MNIARLQDARVNLQKLLFFYMLAINNWNLRLYEGRLAWQKLFAAGG